MRAAIKAALDNFNKSKERLRETIKEEQLKCDHKIVIHSNWRASDYGSAFYARRLCLECRLEEEAKNSGWGDHDADFNHLKTKGFHKVVPGGEIYSHRLPTVPVTCECKLCR